MSNPPPKKPFASRGVLSHVVANTGVTDDQSLASMMGRFDQERHGGEFPVSETKGAPIGREFGAVRTVPLSRARRDLTSIIRRGETVIFTKHGRPMVIVKPADARET